MLASPSLKSRSLQPQLVPQVVSLHRLRTISTSMIIQVLIIQWISIAVKKTTAQWVQVKSLWPQKEQPRCKSKTLWGLARSKDPKIIHWGKVIVRLEGVKGLLLILSSITKNLYTCQLTTADQVQGTISTIMLALEKILSFQNTWTHQLATSRSRETGKKSKRDFNVFILKKTYKLLKVEKWLKILLLDRSKKKNLI